MGKRRESDRLPPGQVRTAKFPVLHLDGIPAFDPKAWRLRVKGEVDKTLELNYDEVLARPRFWPPMSPAIGNSAATAIPPTPGEKKGWASEIGYMPR